MTCSSVDITIPVLNEQDAIVRNLNVLSSYLSSEASYEWSITVVDNGSSDETWSLANSFARANPKTRVLRLARPGRGGALKEAWSTSEAEIVAYMDVDLSTGLESLRPLLDPVARGEADVSIGSRLAPGAKTERSVQREVISRIYNIIARRCLGYAVRDAQCGFKALRSAVARDLIPRIVDDGWFFDTELLTLAWRDGLRINEIPVHWVEDNDSRVRIVTTALDDLRGIWRLSRPGSNRASGLRGGRKRAIQESSGSQRVGKDRPVDFDE
jgi:glycosyltransferase involved in cell wall biosynthesis